MTGARACDEMDIEIREDDLGGPEIAALLQVHLEYSRDHTPPQSAHALDLEGLRAPGITFWTMWRDGELIGCGALKQLAADHGEIKSMHTAEAHRGRGIAVGMLSHIIEEARRRGYRRLRLETGAMDAYAPARALYRRFGFVPCRPFADYREDPNSVYLTLELAEGR